MEYLAIGDPLVQAFGSEHHATKTELIVSPYCWSLCKDNFEAYFTDDGHAVITAKKGDQLRAISSMKNNTSCDPEHLRGYIPNAVVPYASQNDDKWIDEIRQITVLFVNLGVGEEELVNMTTDRHYMRIHTILRAVQTACYKYEGSLNKFLMDDKGSTLLAAFGLPPAGHSNDALRGIMCAFTIVQSLKELGLRASCGVTTGTAFCGVVGGRGRREYSVLGDMVNLSARLMQYSKTTGAGITIDTDTAEAAQAHPNPYCRIFFSRISEITVKGKSKPITIWQPMLKSFKHQHLDSRLEDFNPMSVMHQNHAVAESQLEEIYRSVCEGKESTARCVIFEKQTGFGQDSVVSSFLAWPKTQHFVLHTCGDAFRNTKVGLVWCVAVEQLMSDIEDEREFIRKELEANGKDASLAAVLKEILPYDFEGGSAIKDMSKEDKLNHCMDFLIIIMQKLFELRAPKRCALVIDQAINMDEWSVSFLAKVLKEIPTIFVIVLTIPLVKINTTPFVPCIPPAWTEVKGFEGTTRINMMQWDRKSLVDRVEKVLGVEDEGYVLPKALVDLLLEKCKGNPNYAELLVQHFLDEELITLTAYRVHVTKTLCPLPSYKKLMGYLDPKSIAMPVPVELAGPLTSQVDRLTLMQGMILKTAAVIGDEFSINLLKKIFPLSHDSDAELDESISDLAELGVITVAKELSNDDHTGKFVDFVMRDVLLTQMPKGHQMSLINKMRPLLPELLAARDEFEKQDSATDGSDFKFNDSIIEGWLLKRKGKAAKFGKKYVAVSLDTIWYCDPEHYETLTKESNHKEFNLSVNTQVECMGETTTKFSVSLGELHRMEFDAETPEMKKRWMDTLQNLIYERSIEQHDYHSVEETKIELTVGFDKEGSITSVKEQIYPESVLEGWLLKQGNSVKSWKLRYFILYNGKLSYYRDKKNIKKSKGDILLHDKCEVTIDGHDDVENENDTTNNCNLAISSISSTRVRASTKISSKSKKSMYQYGEEQCRFVLQMHNAGRDFPFVAEDFKCAQIWKKKIGEVAAEHQKSGESSNKKMANHSVKEGLMAKKGGSGLHRWRNRWFVLFTDQMQYFTEFQGVQKGDFKLYRETTADVDPHNAAHIIILPSSKSKAYNLDCGTPENAAEWVKTMKAQTQLAPPFGQTAL